MSFFEDIASALDAEGIESRVNGDVLFVPITSDVEIQFVEIDAVLPAANVYIAAADVDEDDEYFDAALVSVATVAEHIATDQVVTVLRDLLDGHDDRIADLEFEHHYVDPGVVVAQVASYSQLRVLIEVVDGDPTAKLSFITFDSEMIEAWSQNTQEGTVSDQAVEEFNEAAFAPGELIHGYEPEILELGSYTDFDRLFDVLSLCADQAEDWEARLTPCDDGIEL